jgi:hypothetical protein
MNEQAELQSDDFRSVSIEVIGKNKFYLAGAVVSRATLCVGKDVISGGEFSECLDGPPQSGQSGCKIFALSLYALWISSWVAFHLTPSTR